MGLDTELANADWDGYERAKLLCDQTELASLREWLASWGNGPNWSDPKGETIPIVKQTLARLISTAEYAWERFEDLKERDQGQPF